MDNKAILNINYLGEADCFLEGTSLLFLLRIVIKTLWT